MADSSAIDAVIIGSLVTLCVACGAGSLALSRRMQRNKPQTATEAVSHKPPSDSVSHSSSERSLRKVLEAIGCGQYVTRFEENRISLTMLAALSDSDLRELGVDAMGDRKRILSLGETTASASKPFRGMERKAPEPHKASEAQQPQRPGGLTSCSTCQGKLSTTAQSCPHCGAQGPTVAGQGVAPQQRSAAAKVHGALNFIQGTIVLVSLLLGMAIFALVCGVAMFGGQDYGANCEECSDNCKAELGGVAVNTYSTQSMQAAADFEDCIKGCTNHFGAEVCLAGIM